MRDPGVWRFRRGEEEASFGSIDPLIAGADHLATVLSSLQRTLCPRRLVPPYPLWAGTPPEIQGDRGVFHATSVCSTGTSVLELWQEMMASWYS